MSGRALPLHGLGLRVGHCHRHDAAAIWPTKPDLNKTTGGQSLAIVVCRFVGRDVFVDPSVEI